MLTKKKWKKLNKKQSRLFRSRERIGEKPLSLKRQRQIRKLVSKQ